MRKIAAGAFLVAVLTFLVPESTYAQGYCQPGLLDQHDLAGVYQSAAEQMRVTVYPCGAVHVLWSNPYGTHEAGYAGVERMDGGGILARLAAPDPFVRSLDGRNVVGVKPAEPGWVQIVTAGPFGEAFRVYRLHKIA